MPTPKSSEKKTVVVIGGGYAGLACLIELHKRDKETELHLVDPGWEHCKLTGLHKTLRLPLTRICVPYATLKERFAFTHHHRRVNFELKDLQAWQKAGRLNLSGEDLPFDALVIATGAQPIKAPSGACAFDQEDFRKHPGQELLAEFLDRTAKGQRHISVIGGGATGIQFLFELREALKTIDAACHLRLIDIHPQALPELPQAFHRHVLKKMQSAGIEYLPETSYRGQAGTSIRLENLATGEKYALDSELTLLFPGVTPSPLKLETNGAGQVLVKGKPLEKIFAAGDCSHFNSRGLNALTAQAALRKGMLVAENIHRSFREQTLLDYRYHELGYFISLGSGDAIGWLGLKANVLKGFSAYAIKEAQERQYDLFLGGIDTYFTIPGF